MIRKFNTNNQKGFTLIELMIVIAIIGILSAIAIPNFLSYRNKGIEAAVESEAKSFYSAAVAYIADSGTTAQVTEAILTTENVYDAEDGMVVGGHIVADGDGVVTSTATFTYKGKVATLDAFGNVTVTDE